MTASSTWKCQVCGFIHQGQSPPDTCPVCGVGPELFEPFEVVVAPPAAQAASAWRCTICDHQIGGMSPPGTCPVCGASTGLFEPLFEKGSAGAETVRTKSGNLVVLGAGIAGLTAAETARRIAPELTIRLLNKEPHPPYYRLNLTRFLAGSVTQEALALRPLDWFQEQRIELVQGQALRIDRVAHLVMLHDGRRLPYDRLVLANGAHSFVPPIPGVTREGVMTLRTLQDVLGILGRITVASPAPGRRCVCIGGGLLGLETAGGLARRGLQVTVLEGFGWLLPRQLAEPAGRLLQRELQGQGIQVRCGIKVKEILGDDTARSVLLADGEEIPADLVVLAAGVRPNSHLARSSGLLVQSGVLVNDQMITSDPDILAAGDVAEHRGVVHGLWPAAYAQGVIAGTNAAGGGPAELAGLAPSTRLKVLSVEIFSIGQFQVSDASFSVCERESEGSYHRLVCRDGRIVGANLYGDTRLAGEIREAVEAGIQISELGHLVAELPHLAGCCGPSAAR